MVDPKSNVPIKSAPHELWVPTQHANGTSPVGRQCGAIVGAHVGVCEADREGFL